ncbi:MAG: DUF2807 domain-containing protein [Anaerolineae bacterium]|nr:DUF2807 domain-containing protein [Anaerolineae bacterium]
MRNVSIIHTILLALILSACHITVNDFQISPGSGRVISETREVQNFDKVTISGVGEVFIQQGNQESIRIEAEDNVLDIITTQVTDGTLYIGFKDKGWNRFVLPYKTPKFYLKVKNLRAIEVNGALRVEVEPLKTDSLGLQTDGAAEIIFQNLQAQSLQTTLNGGGFQCISGGKVSEQDVVVNGVGRYEAGDLQSDSATVKLRGAGEVLIRAQNTLNATLDGAGAIRYYGAPSGERTINGVGTISKIAQ